MCAPKKPKIEPTPVRAAAVLPDGGDPAARNTQRSRQRLSTSAMIFANRGGTLGMPSTSGPLGTGGM